MLVFKCVGGVTVCDTAGSIGQLQIITGGLLTRTAVLLPGGRISVGLTGGVIGGGITFDAPGDAGALTQALMSRKAIVMTAKSEETTKVFCCIGICIRLYRKNYNNCFNYENNRNYRVLHADCRFLWFRGNLIPDLRKTESSEKIR